MKHMKKSMLITTVMMVVLLVVALSTATFAWFTSNTTVNATATTINSADASSANIEFVWKNGANVLFNGTSVAFSTGTLNIQPMIPTAVPTTTDTSMGFIGSTIAADGATFTADSSSQTAWTQNYVSKAEGTSYTLSATEPANWSTHYTTYYTTSDNGTTYTKVQPSGTIPSWTADTYYSMTATVTDPYGIPAGATVTNLYIANKATSGTTGNLTVTATIADVTGNTLAAAMRIAVFFQATGDAGAVYKGTIANAAGLVNFAKNGTWTASSLVSEQVTNTGYSSTTSVVIGALNANAEGALKIYVWYDGTMLGNTNATSNASFSLNISAS